MVDSIGKGAGRFTDGSEPTDDSDHPIPPAARHFSASVHQRVHRFSTALVCGSAVSVAWWVLHLAGSLQSAATLLSTGAIVAT